MNDQNIQAFHTGVSDGMHFSKETEGMHKAYAYGVALGFQIAKAKSDLFKKCKVWHDMSSKKDHRSDQALGHMELSMKICVKLLKKVHPYLTLEEIEDELIEEIGMMC